MLAYPNKLLEKKKPFFLEKKYTIGKITIQLARQPRLSQPMEKQLRQRQAAKMKETRNQSEGGPHWQAAKAKAATVVTLPSPRHADLPK